MSTTKYIDNETLRALLRRKRKEKCVSNELALAFTAIAGGVWDRYHFTSDRDDFIQEAYTHLAQRPLMKAKLGLNLFAYFTTCTIRFGQKLRDKANAERRRFDAYAHDLADSGRPIIERRARPHEEPSCD